MAYLDLNDLAKELEDLEELETEAEEEEDATMDEDDSDRLTVLRNLQDQFFNNNLAEYAENEPILIPDYEFEEYAQGFAESVGYIEHDSTIAMYIDWEKWASDLKMDYTEVEFEGSTYLIRAY